MAPACGINAEWILIVSFLFDCISACILCLRDHGIYIFVACPRSEDNKHQGQLKTARPHPNPSQVYTPHPANTELYAMHGACPWYYFAMGAPHAIRGKWALSSKLPDWRVGVRRNLSLKGGGLVTVPFQVAGAMVSRVSNPHLESAMVLLLDHPSPQDTERGRWIRTARVLQLAAACAQQ